MSDATFETFLVSGLLVLIAAIAYLAWSAWRWVDRERDMEKRAMAGIGYELRHNLKRMMTELAGLANGSVKRDFELVPVVHPQLDALLSRPNEADRGGLTVIRGNYNELSAHKQSLRVALASHSDIDRPANVAVDAVIGSLATLYLWEEHKGCAPETARSTRSWDVRDWMKANKFHANLLPGLHLRDQVVERLRRDGMTLTPKPLTYTASEYFAKQYDRKADPNAPFWKRKKKKEPVEEAAAAAVVAETVIADEPVAPAETIVETSPAVTETVETPTPPETVDLVETAATPEPTPSAQPEPAPVVASEPEIVAAEPSVPTTEPDPVEPSVESTPQSKPPTPGAVH
ncbi:MAG: hypothetical protein AAF269_07500 [Pseudomonadota bacterium]